ncbi:hypothetical protein GSI_14606 [Ganoderma sinense ZZ0214-1]|uniref:Uncharacterized protein n=1 Tax=Ganoderma sinense ZZ0214-1 TaxID=1077348 RepID=A0A2G8RP65_9APHY|nr:hypothetical protein GSI_14606 [Ganoderma sinense ZZ0214-1]
MPDTATTNATCSTEYDWMTNSLGQSPCVVTSHLFASCGDGCAVSIDNCTIPAALSPGANYTNPDNTGFGFDLEYGVCTCTTVWYSTLSACAACQGRGLAIDPWIVYSAQCDPLYIQKFPNPIPNGTAVPGWAFLPISNDMFDLKSAQALALIHPAENQAPTIIPGQLSSTTLPTSALPTSTTSGTSTSTATSSSNPGVSKKNLAGIIAGSVVGGGVFFLALAAFMFCYRRRRRTVFYTDKLDQGHDLPPAPDPYLTSPTSTAPSRPPKSTTTLITSGTHTGSSNHTVLADVAGFPSPRSPPTSKPASSPTVTTTASSQSLLGRVRSGPVAGPSQVPEQELDSGWREGRPGTLPPPYTAD